MLKNRIPSINCDGSILVEIIYAYVSALNYNYSEITVYLRVNCLSQLSRELDENLK